MPKHENQIMGRLKKSVMCMTIGIIFMQLTVFAANAENDTTSTLSTTKVSLPWKRLMTVQEWETWLGSSSIPKNYAPPLGHKTGWTEAELKTRIGYLLDTLQYMNVDAYAVTLRADYFEAARDPNGYYPYRKDITKSQLDTRASWDMFGYLISESHKRNIKVIWWHDPIYYGTANIYMWGNKYNECTYFNFSKGTCGNRRSRLEVDEPAVKTYNYEIVKYVLENYDIDGIDLHEPFYINPSYNPVLIARVKEKYNWNMTSAVYTEFNSSTCSRSSSIPLLNNPACPNIGKLYDVEGDVWEELFAGFRQVYKTSNKKNPNVLLGAGGHHRYKVVHGINIADVMKTGNLDYFSSEDLNISDVNYWKAGMLRTKALFGQDLSWSMGLILNFLSDTNTSIGSNSNFGVEAGLSCEYGSAYLHLYPFSRRNLPFGSANKDTMYKWAHANPPSSFCGDCTVVTAPIFSPLAGIYSNPQNVSITSSTSDAAIHYTTNGTTPTETSPLYSTPIAVSTTTTLKAGAWKTGITPSSITSAAYTISTLGNLAPNPGFETDPYLNYIYYGTGTFSWASDYFHSGAKSLKIVSSQASGQFARWISKTNTISANAGKSYTASAWMKTSNVSQYGELLINFWDINKVYLNKYYISNHVNGTSNWTQLTVSGAAPANTKYIRAEFRLYGPGTIWVDDVELK